MKRGLTAAFTLACMVSSLMGATLVDFGQRTVSVNAFGMSPFRTTNELGPVLRVNSAAGMRQHDLFLTKPGGWDLSNYGEISFPVKNPDPEPFVLWVSVVSVPPGSPANTPESRRNEKYFIEGSATTIVRIPLNPPPVAPQLLPSELFGMTGLPYFNGTVHPGAIRVIQPFLLFPARPYTFFIGNLVATGAPVAPPSIPIPPFPLVDVFGQWRHRDWPGKVHAASELADRAKAESADLAANPGATNWNAYGGWTGGPVLEATGHFRTAKVGTTWHLVDPEGRLFFSMGMNCVNFGNYTPMIDREDWFEALPPSGAGFLDCFADVSPRLNYFQGKKSPAVSHNAYALKLRYGARHWTPFVDVTHRRLRSWGFNTAGNWSASEFQNAHRVPYTAFLETSGPTIHASKGVWAPFRDVFHPDFRNNFVKTVSALKGVTNDPWCIGFFVDNELAWNEATSLGSATFASPTNQPAKQVFVADLQARYATVKDLNAVWGTQYPSWKALLESTDSPDPVRARADLVRFTEHIADTYFSTVRSVLHSVAPNKLYLGSRFAVWSNTNVARVAGRHCDVVSFNIYGRSHRQSLTLIRSVGDRPVIVGEFGFGASDRGMFNSGSVPVGTQAARAAGLKRFVNDCLKDPQVVGCHWFQYWDQPVTGRAFDGENTGWGFLDVTGTPYPELVEACREVTRPMYTVRTGIVPIPPSKTNQTITFSAPSEITYGTLAIPLSPVSSSGLPVTVEVVSGPATVTGNVVQVTGAGTITLRAAQPGSAAFNAATPVVRTIAVARAPLVILADSVRRAEGAGNPRFTATYSGFVRGDTPAALDTPVRINTTATETSPSGIYPITPSGAADANYDITFIPGTLTVVPAVLAFQQSSAADGVLSVEVEHFDRRADAGGRSWQATPCPGSSGAAVAALPNIGGSVEAGSVSGSPRLDFVVNFVRTGTHYIWVRGLGPSLTDDSCHIGLDGEVPETSDRINGFTANVDWSRSTMDQTRATFVVLTPGLHTLHLWMREDAFIADKVVVTSSATYTPTGLGPAESVRSRVPGTLLNGNGDVALVPVIPTVSAFQQSAATDGVVSLEVEHYDRTAGASGRTWQPAPCPGGSGTALGALPNPGITLDIANTALSPRLDFVVNFVRTGTHYVWVRGLGATVVDDSCHVGLDGLPVTTSDRINGFTPQVGWTRSTMDVVRASFVVTTPGLHTVHLWMREDGFVADKIVLTPDENFSPQGLGPAESARVRVPGSLLTGAGEVALVSVAPTVAAFEQSETPDGVVALEVEHYDRISAAGVHSWKSVAVPGGSGGSLQAMPNNEVRLETADLDRSPRLDFVVNFLQSGIHYIWVRGMARTQGDDSCHVGLDGFPVVTGSRIHGFKPAWEWSNSTMDGFQALMVIPTPGLHTIHLWMREDGFVADKIVLAAREGFTPSGAGPTESPRVQVPTSLQ